jgi:hypothetical protein
MPAIGTVERAAPEFVGFGGRCYWWAQAFGPMGDRDGIASFTPPEIESLEHA